MNPNPRRRNEQGTILVVTLVAAVLVVGFAYAFLVVSRGEIEGAKTDARRERALQAAEAGVDEALDRINAGESIGRNVTLDRTSDARLTYLTTSTDLESTADGTNVYTLRSSSTVGDSARAVEVVLENRVITPRPRAAVTANGPITLAGNVFVDGTDHDGRGFPVLPVDPNAPPVGVYALASSGHITVLGGVQLGGNGHGLTSDPNQFGDTFKESVPYGDGIDQDGDGRVDEEVPNGRDDDGDGLVDEDLSEYPQSPDSLLGLPDGTLRRVAQTQGTYFTSASDFATWVSRNGNQFPGGAIVVLDFPATEQSGPILTPVTLGSEFAEQPSILVFHSPYSNAVLGDLQGRFKGFILADVVLHVNGDARILGGIYTFGSDQLGSAFGSGTLSILFSSEVLASLPVVPYFTPRAWREIAAGSAASRP
jgi:hypothetical protein